MTNQYGNSVSAYSIDATSGVLTTVPGSPFAAGAGPTTAAADLTGKFLYVANGDDSTISAYAINSSTGALTAVAGSPFASPRAPYGIVVDPAGKCLYVANLLHNSVSS